MPKTTNTILFLAFVFLLSSCSPCRRWQAVSADAVIPCYSFGKIYLPPENLYAALELEIRQESSGLRGYVNCFSMEFPADPKFPAKTPLLIHVDEDNAYEFLADRLEGNQRIVLPDDALALIVSYLIEGKTLKISSARFSSTLIPDYFPRLFTELTLSASNTGMKCP